MMKEEELEIYGNDLVDPISPVQQELQWIINLSPAFPFPSQYC